MDNGNEDFRTISTNDASQMEESHTGEHLEVQSSSTGFSFSVDAFRVEIENKQSGDYVVEAEQQPIIDPASFQADLLARLGLGPTRSIETPIETLYTDLKNPFWEERAIAARTLGTINLSSGEERETCIIKLRVRALADPDFRVRIAAIEALGKIAHDEASSVLTLVLQQEQQPIEVRAAALRTLGTLGESTDAQPIIIALQDEHGIIRSLAVQILGERKQIEHVHYFFMALEDDDSSVRIEAMKAIASISGKKALSRISFIAWKDRDPRVRFEAQAILDTFGVLSASQRLHMALHLSSPKSVDDDFDWSNKDLNTNQDTIPSTIKHVPQTMYDHSATWFAPEPVASQHKQPERTTYEIKSTHLRKTPSEQEEHTLYIPQISFPDDVSKEKRLGSKKSRRQHLHPAIRQIVVIAMIFLFLNMTIIGGIHQALSVSDNKTTNDAQWAGPPIISQIIQKNQPFSIKVSFKNTGATQWSEQDGYQLIGTFTGSSPVLLLQKQYFDIGTQAIQPGNVLSMEIRVVAPASPGHYQLQWHIARHNKPFGTPSAFAEIQVYSEQLESFSQGHMCLYTCKTKLPAITHMLTFPSKPRKFQQEQLSTPIMGGGSFSLPDSY